jgi:hypothetical protein
MTTQPPQLPDDALVVRGGQNTSAQLDKSFAAHPAGVTGVSVESAAGLGVVDLAATIPHGRVGVTTVGRVRAAGGDVVPTPSHRSPNHATLTGLTPEQISGLLTPTVPNPARRTGPE